MSIQKIGEWGKAARILNAYSTRFGVVVDQAVHREALRYEKAMKEGLKDQGAGPPGRDPVTGKFIPGTGGRFAPLSPITIALKKSSKALIDKGDMRNSIGTRKITLKAYFVGLHRTARNRSGASLANIGAVHELGAEYTQRVTAKQARFFRALYMKGLWPHEDFRTVPREGSTIRTRIPARPFVSPVLAELAPGASKRVLDDILKGIGLASRF